MTSIPVACPLEDLPGFTRPSPARLPPSLMLILVSSFLITTTEGCLPSWFRHERSEPERLEGNGLFSDEVLDPDLPPGVVAADSSDYTSYPGQRGVPGATIGSPRVQNVQGNHYERTNKIEADYDYEEDLDARYGVAKPLKVDPKMEEARQNFSKIECQDYCFHGGTCHVVVDHNYEYVAKSCLCPKGYYRARCDDNYNLRMFAPVRGRVHVERSAVPALAFLLVMVVIAVGIVVYSYRKLSDRIMDGYKSGASSMVLSQQLHLNRRHAVYGTPVFDLTPRSNGSRMPFSPTPRRYGRLAVNLSPHRLPLSSSGISLPMTNLNNSSPNQRLPHAERVVPHVSTVSHDECSADNSEETPQYMPPQCHDLAAVHGAQLSSKELERPPNSTDTQ